MTMHIGSHPLISKGIDLHGDNDVDRLDDCLVLSQLPSKVSGSAALAFLCQLASSQCLYIGKDHPCHSLCSLGGHISYVVQSIQHPGPAGHYWLPGAV